MQSEVKSEMRGNVLIVSFNRPDHANAMTLDMANQLFNVLKPATTDRAVRAVLLRGMGGNFMDGLDMSLYAGEFNTALERANHLMLPYHSAIREIQVMDKPVLAAIDGKASGVGLAIMLACDLVLAARGAKFNCNYAAWGMTPDGGLSFYLARKAGAMKANELMMLSETFSAEDAVRWNLINGVADDAKLQDEALAWTERLAAGPTKAFGGIKKLVLKAFEHDLNNHLGLEHTYWGGSVRSFDFREAVRAHFAKRPAKFSGA